MQAARSALADSEAHWFNENVCWREQYDKYSLEKIGRVLVGGITFQEMRHRSRVDCKEIMIKG